MEEKWNNSGVRLAREIGKDLPELKGIATGVEGLDELFFTTIFKGGKVKVKPLGGYPEGGVIQITGVPDTGKSLMAEQFLITQARFGNYVCLVTVEQPAAFYVASLKQRAAAMSVKWERIDDKIVIVDAASDQDLRDDIPRLMHVLDGGLEKYPAKVLVIDSVTGLYEAKEMAARNVVRQFYGFSKKRRLTSLFISQKRSGHQELSSEAAGGYGVGHIVDATIVLAKKEIMSRYDQSLYAMPMGELIRLFRIDGCRLCGHDTKTRFMEITDSGIVKIGEPVSSKLNR